MSVEIEDRVRTAADLPWSREIYVDEDGGYLARVPELPGCFADGDTAEEAQASLNGVIEDWLTIAFERGERIPAPRRLADQYSGRFSVRIPRSLHASLSKSAETEGCSLNQLVTTVLAAGTRGGAVTPLGENAPEDLTDDAHEDLAAAAVGRDDPAIAALKGIATFARKQGQVNLASLLYAKAASVIAERQGSEAAARELGVAASYARRDRRNHMAEALLRESLRHDPTNLRSTSMLGQLLYFKGGYVEAVPYLERAAFVDNYAEMFLGWSMLLGGLESEDDRTRSQGLTHLDEALRKWAFGNGDSSDRASWLRQVRRLAALGEQYRELSVRLIAFASAQSSWGPMNAELLVESTDDTHETFNEGVEVG